MSTEPRLGKLLYERRELRGDDLSRATHIGFNLNSIGAWNEAASVARIYRQFADMVILNDAVLLGNHWVEQARS
jgi:hypothetical protein